MFNAQMEIMQLKIVHTLGSSEWYQFSFICSMRVVK